MTNEQQQGDRVSFDMYLDATPNAIRSDEDKVRFARRLHLQLDENMDAILARKIALPAIVVKTGRYLDLLVEARDLFLHGYFYSCVVMCAFTAERILRDLFADSIAVVRGGQVLPPPEKALEQVERFDAKHVTHFLFHAGIFDQTVLEAFSKLGELRNQYAHVSLKVESPEQDAERAVSYLNQIVEGTVSIFKDFDIRDGRLVPKQG
jgi:hypothetical protein